MKALVFTLLIAANVVFADARQIDDYQWDGVERIVAIGDLHGDFENYMATLEAAGLVNRKGKWAGGKTHLVQTGDIPDRGPDTREIIEHITKLAKQAKKKGGRVHSLIGNHEAMNVYGDLRYVSDGEFEAFVNRNSAALRDRVYEMTMERMQAADPERVASLPENFRELWDLKHPLGWVEHRQAWDPAWNPDGVYANWVMDRKVAIRINDNLFLHGGISGFYCQNSLDSLTEKVVSKLRNFDPMNAGVLDDQYGPLWYRGLSGDEPEATTETVDAILAHHKVNHIIVGHTPTSGVVWPRYDAKVIQIDTGIASAYGGYVAYLEITPDGLNAGYPSGKLPLPASDADSVAYLEKVMALDPDNAYLKKRLNELLNPPAPELLEQQAVAEDGSAAEATEGSEIRPEPEPEPVPTCGISQ